MERLRRARKAFWSVQIKIIVKVIMNQLGHTRSAHHRDHLLQTPDTFVRAPLPGMDKVTAIVHVAPQTGAAFTQYTAEFEASGVMEPGPLQRFVYVLEGELETSGKKLSAGGFVYCPASHGHSFRAASPARAVVIEKPYRPLSGFALPKHFRGRESEVVPQPLLGDSALEVRAMVPDDATFDFAVNTMTYQPGATLPMVEIHYMEHGLLMLEGGGIYRLGKYWYPVTAGDFIWMAPYCPQWFGALGKTPAKYLIYKDWNRHPVSQQR
jgi:(S)-ureidoglycine aminohydrolase